jgi:hypothetical protein
MNVDPWSDRDLVHAVVLPDLQPRLDDFYEKKTEFTEAQARQMDLSGLPILINHDKTLGRMGDTVAYAVRDKSADSNARAEVLLALTDPDTVEDGSLQHRLRFQQNALMNGAHRDVSLAHAYDVQLVSGTVTAAAGSTAAAAMAGGQCVVRKEPFEISTCDEGKRKGSRVLAYLPSDKTLQRATEGAVRDFCRTQGFVQPPQGIDVSSAEWRAQIKRLSSEVGARRRALFVRNSSGVHCASSGAASSLPWHFVNPDGVGVFTQQDVARIFDALMPPPTQPPAAAQPTPVEPLPTDASTQQTQSHTSATQQADGSPADSAAQMALDA